MQERKVFQLNWTNTWVVIAAEQTSRIQMARAVSVKETPVFWNNPGPRLSVLPGLRTVPYGCCLLFRGERGGGYVNILGGESCPTEAPKNVHVHDVVEPSLNGAVHGMCSCTVTRSTALCSRNTPRCNYCRRAIQGCPRGCDIVFFWTSKPVGGGFRSPRETHSRAQLSLTTTYHKNTQS